MKSAFEKERISKATASDVAELVGVSKWTVLRAFKPDASVAPRVREEVLAASKKLGYMPNLLARGLKGQKTYIIGVVADEFTNPHTFKMLNETTRQLNKRGYVALLLNVDSGENYRSVVQMAGQLQVDALIYLATIINDELVVATKELHHIPTLHVCRNTDSAEIEVINIDGFNAGAKLGQLLVDQNYQNFGYMQGPETSSTHLLRVEGYRACLTNANKALNIILVAGHYDRELAYKVFTEYLKATPAEDRIDALFCENDVLAFGAMQAIKDFDSEIHIGVVGFDNVDEARFSTWELTTWDQRCDLQIAEAISRLLDNSVEKNGGRNKGELCLRKSHLNISCM